MVSINLYVLYAKWLNRHIFAPVHKFMKLIAKLFIMQLVFIGEMYVNLLHLQLS